MVTKKIAASALLSYMRHETTLASLVDWAEDALLEADFPEIDVHLLTQVLGRLGLADVRTFGLSWEECENLVKMLGYELKVQMMEPV